MPVYDTDAAAWIHVMNRLLSHSPRSEILRLLPRNELEEARSHLEEFQVARQAVLFFPAPELGQQRLHRRGGASGTFPRLRVPTGRAGVTRQLSTATVVAKRLAVYYVAQQPCG